MSTSPKDYWGYLIDPQTKGPSPRLEQLLLGIAHYVIKNVEPRDHHVLTPVKLNNYYTDVGAAFDAFFIDSPPSSLSFIYSALGCFHSLQPSENPYKPPSIPALTTSGFVRWSTIQILLQPDNYVKYLQETVSKYPIPNKGDGGLLGSVFPPNLPRDSFPAEPDQDMIRWHEDTLQQLKRDCEPDLKSPGARMQREYSGARGSESESDADEAPAAAGGASGGYFVSRLRDKIQQRLGSRQNSKDSRDARDSRERKYKYRDDVDAERDRDSQARRRRSYEGRSGHYTSPSSEEMPRRARNRRAYTGSSYESGGSPSSPLSPMSQGHSSRRGDRQYSYRDRDRDRDRDRHRHRGSDEALTPPPSVRLQRPTQDSYARRHSTHYPHTTLAPEDEPPRARSRSHDRSPTRMSPGRFAPEGRGGTRPASEYFPPPPSAGAPPPPQQNFSRGKMRHTVHSPGGSPYRGRRKDDGAYSNKDPNRRLEEGWRYVPADRNNLR